MGLNSHSGLEGPHGSLLNIIEIPIARGAEPLVVFVEASEGLTMIAATTGAAEVTTTPEMAIPRMMRVLSCDMAGTRGTIRYPHSLPRMTQKFHP